jgi:hypothetical protein
MPFSADPLRYLSRNEVFNTGDRCASPFGLRGSSRQRIGPPNDRGSPGSLLSPKSKNTGLWVSTQSRRSAPSFDRSEYVSGLALTIEALASDSRKPDLSQRAVAPLSRPGVAPLSRPGWPHFPRPGFCFSPSRKRTLFQRKKSFVGGSFM